MHMRYISATVLPENNKIASEDHTYTVEGYKGLAYLELEVQWCPPDKLGHELDD